MFFLEKKSRLTLLFLLTSLLILEIFAVIIPEDQLSSNAANCELTSPNDIINESKVINRFNEIKNISYDESLMNCKNKSELFADYLKSNGATDIYLVTVAHSSGKYSHEFVEWKGHYYDTCSSDTSYKHPKDKYLSKIRGLGFNGVVVTSPYQ